MPGRMLMRLGMCGTRMRFLRMVRFARTVFRMSFLMSIMRGLRVGYVRQRPCFWRSHWNLRHHG